MASLQTEWLVGILPMFESKDPAYRLRLGNYTFIWFSQNGKHLPARQRWLLLKQRLANPTAHLRLVYSKALLDIGEEEKLLEFSKVHRLELVELEAVRALHVPNTKDEEIYQLVLKEQTAIKEMKEGAHAVFMSDWLRHHYGLLHTDLATSEPFVAGCVYVDIDRLISHVKGKQIFYTYKPVMEALHTSEDYGDDHSNDVVAMPEPLTDVAKENQVELVCSRQEHLLVRESQLRKMIEKESFPEAIDRHIDRFLINQEKESVDGSSLSFREDMLSYIRPYIDQVIYDGVMFRITTLLSGPQALAHWLLDEAMKHKIHKDNMITHLSFNGTPLKSAVNGPYSQTDLSWLSYGEEKIAEITLEEAAILIQRRYRLMAFNRLRESRPCGQEKEEVKTSVPEEFAFRVGAC